MFHGIGVDLLHKERIKPLMDNLEDPFFQRTYTAEERAQAKVQPDPLRYFAERFAAKEAVLKAMRIAPESIRWNEIEILNDVSGIPCVQLHGNLSVKQNSMGIRRIHISLSNDGAYNLAFVVCEV